ncbi:hypothetical protein HMPREF9412_5523 [Paenibacillus sp. HGF5]|nr:hypothetical protein HMPREF9412_5523 [Paenibacillus sp. HGF5]
MSKEPAAAGNKVHEKDICRKGDVFFCFLTCYRNKRSYLFHHFDFDYSARLSMTS